MNKDDFKKLLDEALNPIRQDLQDVKIDLQEVKDGLHEVKIDLQEVKDGLHEVKIDLQDVKETQEARVLPSVITTETTIKAYADAYKTNKANIERLDSRVTKLEDNAGIIPPSEFVIHR